MNKALLGAMRKGARAATLNQPREAPYGDIRQYDGKLTWSRAFIVAWLNGYDEIMKQRAAKKRRAKK
jgi:hypothetical protein